MKRKLALIPSGILLSVVLLALVIAVYGPANALHAVLHAASRAYYGDSVSHGGFTIRLPDGWRRSFWGAEVTLVRAPDKDRRRSLVVWVEKNGADKNAWKILHSHVGAVMHDEKVVYADSDLGFDYVVTASGPCIDASNACDRISWLFRGSRTAINAYDLEPSDANLVKELVRQLSTRQ
jgi:hypothetical protein